MSLMVIRYLFWGMILFLFGISSLSAQVEEDYEFELDDFTKKTWEWNGDVSLSGVYKEYNRESVLYPHRFPDNEISNGDESELYLSLESRWDWGWSRLYMSGIGYARSTRNPDNQEDDALLREGYLELSAFTPHSIQVGKQILRWGKGYAFNPVAFLERAKNPEDPEADREGLWLAQGLMIFGAFGILENSSLQLVYLPIRDDLNQDFREEPGTAETLWALKLYALIGTTDIDLYAVRLTEQEEQILGIDFAANLTSYFELHGEYARLVAKEEADESVEQWLLGIRYLTASDITWILEIYHDGSGLDAEESADLYRSLQGGSASQLKAALAEVTQRRTVSRNYGYLKASIKEPFNWLYFTPSLVVLQNLDDGSRAWTFQAGYLPVNNLELNLSWQLFEGNRFSQYGENLTAQKIKLGAIVSF